MSNSGKPGSPTGRQPEGGQQQDSGRAGERRSQPAFGPEEAEAVAAAQEEAVEEGRLPPSRDQARPGGSAP
jgi:hypothetical protein